MWLTEPLEQNLYSVYLRLFDRQGKDQVTVIRAQVCDCQGRVESCAQKPRVDTGVPIVLAVLGAVLALLRECSPALGCGRDPRMQHGDEALMQLLSCSRVTAAASPGEEEEGGEGAAAAT